MSVEQRKKISLLLIQLAGLFSAILGGVVILGWHSHSELLIQLHPTFAPMQYNTALGFLLSGMGCLSLTYSKYRLAAMTGAAVLALGLVTLTQYILSVDFGIDQLFMEHYITTKTSHIGRMAPTTALCFALTGLAILTLQWIKDWSEFLQHQNRAFFVMILAVLVFVLGVVALWGYLFDIETAYGWANLTRMAAHTAVGFVMLGAAIAGFTMRLSEERFSQHIIRFIPLCLTFALMLVSIALWEEMDQQQREYVDRITAQEVELMEQLVQDNIQGSVLALRRMAQRWEVQKGTPQKLWRSDAKNYVADNPALTTVEWVDETYHVRWVEPLKGNEKALGLNIAFNEERQKALQGAAEKNAITLTPPIELVQGYRAVICYVPIHVNGKFQGFIVGIYDTNIFLDSVITEKAKKSFNIKITDGEKLLYTALEEQSLRETQHGTKHEIKIFNRQWTVQTTPKNDYLKGLNNSFPEVLLLAGIIIALLVGSALHYAVTAIRHNLSLKNADAFQRLILSNLPDIVYVKDRAGKIIDANATFEDLFFTRLSDAGTPPEAIKLKIAALEEFITEGDEQAFESGHVELNQNIPSLDGTIRNLHVRKIRFETIQGESFLLCLGRDMTERDKLITQLELSNEDLRNFAYVASHDLKSPLRAIDNLSHWIESDLEELMTEESHENMKLMRQRVKRMESLLDALLEYARIDNKMGETEHEIVSGKEMLEEIKELALSSDVFSLLADKNFKTLQLPRMPIQQVLYNLVSNAAKHHDKENGIIKIEVIDEGNYHHFTVSDDGPGIAKEYQDKIFEMFQTLKSRDKVEGSGMGLALVKKIVTKMQGRIWVESELEKGSTFHFTWPKSPKL